MKIAFLNLYQGKVDRGAETFVYELSHRLLNNHKVDVIAGYSLPKKRWPILWRVFLDPPGLSVLWFTLKNLGRIWREKYDIVIPVNGGWQPAFVRLITWLYGGKMLISGQSGMGWDDRNNLWSFPDVFVAPSSLAKTWARKVNPLVRVEYIPNGVDLCKFTFKGQSFKGMLSRPIVICVGALTRPKRISLLIRAVAETENLSLLIVGKGEQQEETESLGKKLLRTRFQLTNAPFEKMPEIYRSADLFSLPSEPYQSFEIVLVEAMASGLSVVATNDPIRKEIVGEAGILVDPTNVKEYSLSLKKALETNWGDKPRKQAEKFDWDKIAVSYEKLFKSLFPGKTGIL